MAGDPFWSNVFKREQSEEDTLYKILTEIPIFQDFSQREFRKIQGILHRRSWGTGEAIVQEGNPGFGMYIILSGDVDIVHKVEDGSMQKLAQLGAGDFFGEQALLDESPRTAAAITASPCKAIGFFRPDLLELIESNPRLGLKIVMRLSQMISVRLRHTNRLLKEAREQNSKDV
tara:strand:+ start:1426 stop:1947 length:522 start_codon:yes stop_codon:yes gene_type:complete